MSIVSEKGTNKIVSKFAEIICHSPTENVFKNQNNPCVSFDDKISILAVKNQYECGQVTIKPQKDIEFDVSVSDLTDYKGNKISSDKINVYLKKDIYCENAWHYNGFPAGNYPDVLVPFDKAKEYDENKIKGGDFGGFWIEIKIPENAHSSTYKGNIILNIGEIINIPVIVEVLEPVLSDKMTMQTVFNTWTQHIGKYESGDLDKVYENYAQFFLEHRACQTGLVYPVNLFAQKVGDEDENIEILTDAVVKWEKKGVNTFNIPTKQIEIDGVPYFESEYAYKFICSLVKKSIENNIDYISMLVFYDHLVDEPFGVFKENGRVKKSIEMFNEVKKRSAKYCKKLDFDKNFKKQLVKSILAIDDIFTDYFTFPLGERKPLLDENGNPYHYNYKEVTLCPKFDAYDLPEHRREYNVYKDNKWWYGCNAPNTPYPEYNIDEHSADCRIISWMMADYDLKGNLYWGTDCWDGDDPYKLGEIPPYMGANGEGIIVYSGSRYGMDKPVGSIRADNIREGNEEYELIKNMFSLYKENGFDGREVYHRMVCGFYNGTRVDSENVLFDLARQSLLRLLDLAVSDFKGFVSVKENKDNFTLKIKAAQGVSVRIGDLDCIVDFEGCYCFDVPYELLGKIDIRFQKGDIIKVIPLYSGRKIDIILHEELYNSKAISGDIDKIELNNHVLRRAVEIKTNKENPTIMIAHKFDGIKQWVTLEVRAFKETDYKVYVNKMEVASGKTFDKGFNKIDFYCEEKAESFEIEFASSTEISVKTLYVRK